jgi:hypothetical protein
MDTAGGRKFAAFLGGLASVSDRLMLILVLSVRDRSGLGGNGLYFCEPQQQLVYFALLAGTGMAGQGRQVPYSPTGLEAVAN